jgi:uncharacterized protein
VTSVHLLDGNVLVAATTPDHVHHQAARRWLGGHKAIATCPSTQGTLVRVLLHHGRSAADALAVLARIDARPDHQFWADDLGYLHVTLSGVIGARQVTDAYLAEQARRHRARLATFDRGLAVLHPDVVDLVPT